MAGTIGPEGLAQFEDRILYYLVDLTGDRPLMAGSGATEADLAERAAGELEVVADFPRSPGFHSSDARGTVLAAIEALEDDGYVACHKMTGAWLVRPTNDGRRRVARWREEWARQRQGQERTLQRRILEELDRQRRADPGGHASSARVDIERLCADLGTGRDEYLAAAQRLLEQGKLARHEIDQHPLDLGYAVITEAGTRTLEVGAATRAPSRDAQEAWVEVARLKRRLQLAERTLPSLIADEELRRRCQDLLTAEGHYDRVVREACVILENRVRTAIGADKTLIGPSLMAQAFGPKGGSLRVSDVDPEQAGVLQIYQGVMAFFRNAAGHNVIETYTQDDALRLVAMIDLLLRMVAGAQKGIPVTPSEGKVP